jgi:hypothetical protein
MKRRRITLADGRYMIFYTFEDEYPPNGSTSEQAGAQQLEPERPVEAVEPLEEKP